MERPAAPGLRKAITLREAVALYFGSVMGTGIIISPALAANQAGSLSLVVWLAFMLLSYPVAMALGNLALRFPSAGGVSVYVREAFGQRWGTIAGWLFLSAFVVGSPAAALTGASYLSQALGLVGPWVYVLAGIIILAAEGLNLAGITLGGRTQFALMLGVSGFLVVVIVAGLGLFQWQNLQPQPGDLGGLGLAGATIFWSFLGWENAVHAAEEYEDPQRDLRRATVLAVLVISVLYFSLAVVTVGAHAYGGEYGGRDVGTAPFAHLLAKLLGPPALVASGVLAVVVTFGTINAYALGVSRLTYGMARTNAFPAYFEHLDPGTQVPRRALVLLVSASLVVLLLVALLALNYENMFLLVSASFIGLYLLAAGAAMKLLPSRTLRTYALLTLVFFAAFLVAILPYALYPIASAVAALLYLRARRWAALRRVPTPPGP